MSRGGLIFQKLFLRVRCRVPDDLASPAKKQAAQNGRPRKTRNPLYCLGGVVVAGFFAGGVAAGRVAGFTADGAVAPAGAGIPEAVL